MLSNMTNAPALTYLTPGTWLQGRFEVESLINMGGFSLIYRAVDRAANRYVVIKECAPEGLVYRDAAGQIVPASAEGAALMQRLAYNSRYEAYVLSTLTSQGVTNITGYVADFEANGTHYIAMEEARGSDLHQWAEYYRQQGVPFPAQALEEILTAVLNVLQKVHNCGFFHCDVKPANIVIDNEGNLMLIDFGAVRTEEQQHDENVQVSPGFSPPEFYPGQRGQIGPWTDLYMLAALFYEIISGHAPEPANQRVVVDRTPRLSSDLKLQEIYRESLLQSIDKALTLDYKHRFASADAWQEAYTIAKSGPKLLRGRTSYLHSAPGATLNGAKVGGRRSGHVRKRNTHGPLAGGAITAGAGSIKVKPTRQVVTVEEGTSWGMIFVAVLLILAAVVVANKMGYIPLPFEIPFDLPFDTSNGKS